MKNIINTLLIAILLSGCQSIFMSDIYISQSEKNQSAPKARGIADLEFGTYRFYLNTSDYIEVIHQQQTGLTLKSHYLGNKTPTILLNSAFENPIAVSIPGLNASDRISYIQFDDSKRVWLFDEHKKPIRCTPYRACRLNLFKVNEQN